MRFAVAALVLGLGVSGAEAEAPSRRPEDVAQKVLDRRYQTKLPLGREGRVERPDQPSRKQPQDAPARARRDRTRAERQQGTDTVLGGVMQAIGLAVAAVAVLMLVLWILRDLRKGGGNVALEGEATVAGTVDLDVVERPVGDADELARTGRYADAIHTLLLRTLVELVRATHTRVPAALTSREILARVPLVPAARAALDALVAAVEVSYFGDEPAGAADYQRCRAEFQRFADAYRGAA